MHEPRHERVSPHKKPEHGPPVGVATLASQLFKIKLIIALWLNRITRGKSTVRSASLPIQQISAEVDAPHLANKIRQGICKNGSRIRNAVWKFLAHSSSDESVTNYS
jgi:hypothetical protein